MNDLHALVDLAAVLSITAKSEDSRELATRKRAEAMQAIEQEQLRLDKLRAKLALFPLETSGNHWKTC